PVARHPDPAVVALDDHQPGVGGHTGASDVRDARRTMVRATDRPGLAVVAEEAADDHEALAVVDDPVAEDVRRIGQQLRALAPGPGRAVGRGVDRPDRTPARRGDEQALAEGGGLVERVRVVVAVRGGVLLPDLAPGLPLVARPREAAA